MANNEQGNASFHESVSNEMVQTSRFHLNLAQDVLVITEDKFRLCLLAHVERLVAKEKWIAPVSLFLTFVVVLVTSAFHDFIFPAATWQAMFVIGSLATAVWSVVAGIKALRTNTKIDLLVAEVKKTSEALKAQAK